MRFPGISKAAGTCQVAYCMVRHSTSKTRPPPASPAHAYRLLLVCAPRNNSACTRRPARQHTQSTELTVYYFGIYVPSN